METRSRSEQHPSGKRSTRSHRARAVPPKENLLGALPDDALSQVVRKLALQDKMQLSMVSTTKAWLGVVGVGLGVLWSILENVLPLNRPRVRKTRVVAC